MMNVTKTHLSDDALVGIFCLFDQGSGGLGGLIEQVFGD
jgi:hypothetical protein